jgi:hypothetical protein
MADLDLPTGAQIADVLESLREGFLLPLALQQAGVTPEQIDALGPQFEVELQRAFDVGTSKLDKQATALALAGVSSQLLSFLLRSQAKQYRDDPRTEIGIAIGGDRDRSRPTSEGAHIKGELVQRLDQIATRLVIDMRMSGDGCTQGQPVAGRQDPATASPASDDAPAHGPPVPPARLRTLLGLLRRSRSGPRAHRRSSGSGAIWSGWSRNGAHGSPAAPTPDSSSIRRPLRGPGRGWPL